MELFKLLKHDCLRLSCLKIRFCRSKIYFLQMSPSMHLKFIVSKKAISEFICYNIPGVKKKTKQSKTDCVKEKNILEIYSLFLFSQLEAEN